MKTGTGWHAGFSGCLPLSHISRSDSSSWMMWRGSLNLTKRGGRRYAPLNRRKYHTCQCQVYCHTFFSRFQSSDGDQNKTSHPYFNCKERSLVQKRIVVVVVMKKKNGWIRKTVLYIQETKMKIMEATVIIMPIITIDKPMARRIFTIPFVLASISGEDTSWANGVEADRNSTGSLLGFLRSLLLPVACIPNSDRMSYHFLAIRIHIQHSSP